MISITEINNNIKCMPHSSFFDTEEDRFECYTAFRDRCKSKAKEFTDIIKTIKFNSKDYFKNKEEAVDFLQSFRIQSINDTEDFFRPEYIRVIEKVFNKNDQLKINRSCPAKWIYHYIDNYFGEWLCFVIRRIMHIDFYYDSLTKTLLNEISVSKQERYITIFQNKEIQYFDFLFYSIGKRQKINRRIKKMFSGFLERLYNPHTDLGKNWALKEIEWAFTN